MADTNNIPAYVNGALNSIDWSQRRLPTEFSQKDTYNGVVGMSWEYMIELANETNTDMWIDIPGPATDDYVAGLANLIKDGDTVDGVSYPGLNPNLKVYLAYSNEVWGGIPANLQYNAAAAQAEIDAGGSALNNDGTTNLYTLAGRRYLERTMQITDIFRSVLGADPTYSKIRPLINWQQYDWSYFADTLPWFEATYGAAERLLLRHGGLDLRRAG